jgi:hypothetical protein
VLTCILGGLFYGEGDAKKHPLGFDIGAFARKANAGQRDLDCVQTTDISRSRTGLPPRFSTRAKSHGRESVGASGLERFNRGAG